MSDRKYFDVAEWQAWGGLQEANRLHFHPHGLALEVRVMNEEWTEEAIADSPWMQSQVRTVADALLRDASDAGCVSVDGDALRRTAISVCPRSGVTPPLSANLLRPRAVLIRREVLDGPYTRRLGERTQHYAYVRDRGAG